MNKDYFWELLNNHNDWEIESDCQATHKNLNLKFRYINRELRFYKPEVFELSDLTFFEKRRLKKFFSIARKKEEEKVVLNCRSKFNDLQKILIKDKLSK